MLATFVSPQSKWYFNPHPLTRNLLTYFRGNVASTLLLLGYFCIFLRQSTTLHYTMKERSRDRDRESVRECKCVWVKNTRMQFCVINYQNVKKLNKIPTGYMQAMNFPPKIKRENVCCLNLLQFTLLAHLVYIKV